MSGGVDGRLIFAVLRKMRRQKFGPRRHLVGTIRALKDLRFRSWALGFGALHSKLQMFFMEGARIFPQRAKKFDGFPGNVAFFCSRSSFDAGNEAKIVREGDAERTAHLIHTDRVLAARDRQVRLFGARIRHSLVLFSKGTGR